MEQEKQLVRSKELNDSITSLEMATGGKIIILLKQMMSQYKRKWGQELGSITTDIAEGADSWLRQGKSVQETNQLLKDSMVLSKVSDLSASDSTQYLTSAMNGYKVASRRCYEHCGQSITGRLIFCY